jgi:hypothetical protein
MTQLLVALFPESDRTILCGDGFMTSIHRPKNKILKKFKSQRFGSWLCFRPQMNGGGEEKNAYSVGPLRQS